MSNEIKALKFSPDGTVEPLTMTQADSLRTMQTLVGGYIQGVYGWTGHPELDEFDVTFFVNEECKIQNLPVNPKATALWWTLDNVMVGKDYLSGVVVVTGGADRKGDTLSVPDRVVEMVMRVERT